MVRTFICATIMKAWVAFATPVDVSLVGKSLDELLAEYPNAIEYRADNPILTVYSCAKGMDYFVKARRVVGLVVTQKELSVLGHSCDDLASTVTAAHGPAERITFASVCVTGEPGVLAKTWVYPGVRLAFRLRKYPLDSEYRVRSVWYFAPQSETDFFPIMPPASR